MKKCYDKFYKNWNYFLPMKYNNYRYFLNGSLKKINIKCYTICLDGRSLWFLVSFFFLNYHINSNVKITFHSENKAYSFSFLIKSQSNYFDLNMKIVDMISNSKNYYWFNNTTIIKNYFKDNKSYNMYLFFSFLNIEVYSKDLYLLKFSHKKYIIRLCSYIYFKSNRNFKYNKSILSSFNIIYKNTYFYK